MNNPLAILARGTKKFSRKAAKNAKIKKMMIENKIGKLWLDFILYTKSPCLPTGREEHKR